MNLNDRNNDLVVHSEKKLNMCCEKGSFFAGNLYNLKTYTVTTN